MKKDIVACSWSGGKDSCLACYKAIQQGYNIRYIMNFISQEFKRVSFHGIWKDLIKLQAEALRMELVQTEVGGGKNDYENSFRQTLRFLKSKGINTLIAGDILLLDCRNWVEKICEDEGLNVVEPLWQRPSKEILREFIDLGFKAVVTAIQAELLDKSWIGRQVDYDFLKDLEKKDTIDICGENGEYHTLVIDGPLFKQKIELQETEKVKKGNYWFLDIKKYRLKNKGGAR